MDQTPIIAIVSVLIFVLGGIVIQFENKREEKKALSEKNGE